MGREGGREGGSEHEVTSVESPDQQPMGGEGGIIEMGKGGDYIYILILWAGTEGVTTVDSSN